MRTRRPAKAIALAASVGLLSVVTACGSDSGSSVDAPSGTSTAAQTAGESIDECVQRVAGSAVGGEKQDVTLNVLTHDSGAADWLASMGEVLSALPSSPYNYEITQTITGPSDVTVKAQTALQSGTDVPDIVGIEIGEWGNYYSALQDNFVDLTTDLGPLREENIESRWATYSKDGKIYGLETTYPLSMYWYNADEFEKLGIDPTTIKTWDDLLEVSAKTHASGGPYLLSMPLEWRGTTFLAQQQGGGLFDETGAPTLDTPEMTNAAELIKKGVDDGAILGFSVGDFIGAAGAAAMQNGEVIGYAFPDWWLAFFIKKQLPDQEGQWRAMPLPVFEDGGSTTSLSGGHAFTVYSKGSNVDAATLLVVCGGATAEGQVDKYTQFGYLPTNTNAWESPAVLEYEDPFLGNQKIGALFASVRDQAPTFYTSPDLPATTKVFDNYLGQAYRGDIDVPTALSKAQTEAEAASTS